MHSKKVIPKFAIPIQNDMETNQEVINNEPVKKCSHCKQIKPISEFYEQKKAKDHHQNYCAVCSRALSAERYKKLETLTPPQKKQHKKEVKPTDYHPMFSKMQQREVIAEIRERLNYLRDIGWKFEGNLTFVETKTVKL